MADKATDALYVVAEEYVRSTNQKFIYNLHLLPFNHFVSGLIVLTKNAHYPFSRTEIQRFISITGMQIKQEDRDFSQ